MQFLVLGYDGADALERRLTVRDQHVALGDKLRDSGNLLYGAAILNNAGDMCGSILFADFESREKLNEWLKIEPYVVNKVWERVEVFPCQVGPSFENLHLPRVDG